MNEEYGPDFVTVVDEEGQEIDLEILEQIEYKGVVYTAFLPADMDENDPDYGIIILRCVEEKGEIVYETVDDDDLLNEVYEYFMQILFEDEDEDE